LRDAQREKNHAFPRAVHDPAAFLSFVTGLAIVAFGLALYFNPDFIGPTAASACRLRLIATIVLLRRPLRPFMRVMWLQRPQHQRRPLEVSPPCPQGP
jgi:hypothetical protein